MSEFKCCMEGYSEDAKTVRWSSARLAAERFAESNWRRYGLDDEDMMTVRVECDGEVTTYEVEREVSYESRKVENTEDVDDVDGEDSDEEKVEP